MPSVHDIYISDSTRSSARPESWQEPEETYAIHLSIVPEEDGRYSAIALNLPGAGSCGDTKAEAIANAKEAVKGVLESYQESGESIPWKDSRSDKSPGEKKWITVHA